MPLMQSNPQLELARQYVCNTGVSVFLTGKAGTGKTTFLKSLAQTLNKRHAIVAPTGVAAVNAGGVTIHSFFQLPFCPYLPEVKELVTEYQMPESRKQMRKHKADIIRTLELLIIDEISMVRADLLDAIDYTLKRYRRNSRPFGGVQLLMIGDIRQLPPVVTDEEKPYMDQVYPSPFFFHSKALQRTDFITIELTTIYRQQDAMFVQLLNNIRDNRFDEATLNQLNSRYRKDFDGDGEHEYIRLTTHNYQADKINKERMEQLDGKSFVAEANIEGNFPESSAPTAVNLELKKGEQVMFVKNDSSGEHRYYNGKIGIITAIREDDDGELDIMVTDEEGNEITVQRESWENIKYEIDPKTNEIKQKTDGIFAQYPLRPAWAITIHKAQGLTFDYVIINAASAFAYGQVYVALSRCRSFEGMVFSTPLSAAGAIVSRDIIDFDNSRPSEQSVRQLLNQYQTQYYYDTLKELFDISSLRHASERLNRLFQHHLTRIYPKQCQRMAEIDSQMVSLGEVAEKFHSRLTQYFMTMEAGSSLVEERTTKAADYFSQQLGQYYDAFLSITPIDIDNKETQKLISEQSEIIDEALRMKIFCMKKVVADGFSVESYHKAKADSLLEDRADATKKSAKKTARAKQKTSVYAGEENPALIERLTQWRRDLSREQDVPAYIVLQQKSLLEIARRLPRTYKELEAVPGIGKVKIKQYGEAILQIVSDYCVDFGK